VFKLYGKYTYIVLAKNQKVCGTAFIDGGDWTIYKCFGDEGEEFFININEKTGELEIVEKW